MNFGRVRRFVLGISPLAPSDAMLFVKEGGMKKQAWIIPVNTAILFGVLCFWAIQEHDTVWAVICVVLCLLNAFFAYRWFTMKRGGPNAPNPRGRSRV